MLIAVRYTFLYFYVYLLTHFSSFCGPRVKMDRLPPETQEQLKKMSTARLMLKLGKAGYDEDHLEELGRAELLETLAETIIAQSETEQTDLAR